MRMVEKMPIEMLCPVCGQAMIHLHTIYRAFAANLNVFRCVPCGYSTAVEEPPAGEK
jgi:predicted RNA-binding Zn-ribbon protein involved in translation (DUF1610 family)